MKRLLIFALMLATVSVTAQRYDISRLRPAPTKPGQTVTAVKQGNNVVWSTSPAGATLEYAAFITPVNDTTVTVQVLKNTTGINLTWTYADTTTLTTQQNIDNVGNWASGFSATPGIIAYSPVDSLNPRSVISYYTMSDELRLRSYRGHVPRRFVPNERLYVHFLLFP